MSNENPCNSPKRDLGILLAPPSIPPPCDCYVDVLLPVASVFSLFKGIGKRFFARTLLSFELSLLKTPLKRANDIRRYADNVLLSLKEKMQFLQNEIAEITAKITKQLENLTWYDSAIASVWTRIEPLRKEAVAFHNRMTTLAARYNVSYSLQNGVPVVNLNNIPANARPEFSNALSGYNNARNQLSVLTNELNGLEQSKIFTDDAVKLLSRQIDATKKALNSGPTISIGDTSIPSQSIEGQINAVQNLIPVLKREEDRIGDIISRGNSAQVSNNRDTMLNSINEIDNGWSNIAAQAGQLLFDLLNALSIVEKVKCMESGMLDESTCECSKCPQGKQLCVPLQTGLEDLLPQPPNVRMGTELNRCVDACCPGMELARRFSSLSEVINSFIPPCYCKCSDPDKIEKPCNKADCVAKVICASPEPDAGELGFFGTSKYRWDENECDWVCKDGMCTTSTTTASPTTSTTTARPTTSTTTTSPTTSTTTTSPTTSTTTTSPTTSTSTTTSGPTTSTTTPEPCNCPNTINVGIFTKVCQCDWDYTFYKCVASKGGCVIKDPDGNTTLGVCVGNSNSLKNNPAYEWKESECAFGCKNGKKSTSCNDNETWRAETCECIPPTTTCAPCPAEKYRENPSNCNSACVCFECLPQGMIVDAETCECDCDPDTACQDPNKRPKADSTYPTCECECRTICDSPLIQNSQDCSCACPSGPFPVYECALTAIDGQPGAKQCIECFAGGGNTYNPDTCSCECAEECPSPKVHETPKRQNGVVQNPTCECYCPENDVQCECADLFGGTQCPENKEYLYDITLPYKCKCVCKNVLECGSLKNFDTDTCSCVCNNSSTGCLSGEIRDPETCLCVTTTPGPTTSTTAAPTTTTTTTTPAPTTTTTTPAPTTTTTTAPSTTNGPTTQPPCGDDSDCEPFCCVDGICGECPPVEYKWYCTNC
jgi:hypothetical protein